MNHLLVVGFYLINAGYVTLALKYGDKPAKFVQAIEFFSTKIGLVLLVLVLLLLGYAGIAVTYWISELEVRYHLDTSAERVVASLVLFAAVMFPFFFASRRTE